MVLLKFRYSTDNKKWNITSYQYYLIGAYWFLSRRAGTIIDSDLNYDKKMKKIIRFLVHNPIKAYEHFCKIWHVALTGRILVSRSAQSAAEFRSAYNGLQYNSLEPDICSGTAWLIPKLSLSYSIDSFFLPVRLRYLRSDLPRKYWFVPFMGNTRYLL